MAIAWVQVKQQKAWDHMGLALEPSVAQGTL